MTRILASITLCVLLLTSGALRAEEAKPAVDAERLAAAREMMEVTGVAKSLDGMMAAMSQGFSEGANAKTSPAGQKASAEFDAAVAKFRSYKEDMMNDFAALYADMFTAQEMKEVTAFYKSGTGAKFIASMPVLMQKGSDIGMKYGQKIMEEMGAKP